MKITINHAKSLVTREINSYKELEIKPYRAEIMSACKLLGATTHDEKGNVLVEFNDDYKQLINNFIEDNYRQVNDTISFLQAYKELTLYRVAREIENILYEERKLRTLTEKEESHIIENNVNEMYYLKADPLDKETLTLIYRHNKNLIQQNIEKVRNEWHERLVNEDVDFPNKVDIAIDFYLIDYIHRNIYQEIKEYQKFMYELENFPIDEEEKEIIFLTQNDSDAKLTNEGKKILIK